LPGLTRQSIKNEAAGESPPFCFPGRYDLTAIREEIRAARAHPVINR